MPSLVLEQENLTIDTEELHKNTISIKTDGKKNEKFLS